MNEPKLARTLDQWRNCDPEAMANMSQAAIMYALKDAKHDILALAALPSDAAQAPIGEKTASVLRLCVRELRDWMSDYGQDIRSQEAIQRANALLAAQSTVAPAAAAPITRDAFYEALRSALKQHRLANPPRYLNDEQADASDDDFASAMADHHARGLR